MGAVSNPLKADLDCGTNAVKNASQVSTDVAEAKVLVAVGDFTPGGAHGTIQLHAGDGDGVSIYVGKDDPTVNPPNAGIYVRRIDATTTELWIRGADGFVKVAG
jgi:hypothetical protein